MSSAAADIGRLVFDFDPEVLAGFVRVLRAHDYALVQHLPARRSLLALPREPGIVVNLVRRREHRAFSGSVIPGLYRAGLALLKPRLALAYRACFLSERIERSALEACFGAALVQRGVDNGVLRRHGDRHLQFTVSFVPFCDDILLRDPYWAYVPSPTDPQLPDKVWLGADSINLARFLQGFLRGRRFELALDIGSGTGIQILVASRFARDCVAIDVNERAAQFTRLNARLNGIAHVRAYTSNMYEDVHETFDLILANPWFCDLATGGLEEVPAIVEGLDARLRPGGVCVMLINSYVKRGRDAAGEYMRDAAIRRGYDLSLQVARYDIEPDRLAEWAKHDIEYTVVYYAILEKTGTGAVRRHDCSWLQRAKHFARIRGLRAWHRR